MITAACFLPHPPLLLAEYASLADPAAPLRARCRRALADLAARGLDRVVVLSGAQRTGPATSTRAALGLRVARELLGARADRPDVVEATVPFDADPVEVAEGAARLRESCAGVRTGVLVMGDGSARRGEKSPGHVDKRSEAFDGIVAAALAVGDPEPLRGLDPALAAELLAAGRAAWQVFATAVDGRADVVSAHSDDPFGVLYHVAVWRWP